MDQTSNIDIWAMVINKSSNYGNLNNKKIKLKIKQVKLNLFIELNLKIIL